MDECFARDVVGGNKSITNELHMVIIFDIGVGWDEKIVEC
jgi:hypothetical protein